MMAVNASSSIWWAYHSCIWLVPPSDAQAFALEYLKSHPSGNTPLQKLRLFQNFAIVEAVVEVRSRKDSVSVTSLNPFFIRRKRRLWSRGYRLSAFCCSLRSCTRSEHPQRWNLKFFEPKFVRYISFFFRFPAKTFGFPAKLFALSKPIFRRF